MRWSLLLLLPLLLACGSKRRQMELALRYEQEGMVQEAFSGYASLYERKPKEIEAHLGMKRTAQLLLDRKLSEASGQYLRNELQNGDRLRAQAVLFKQDMDRHGLELLWDGTLDDFRREAQHHEARKMFEEAKDAFRDQRYTTAQDLADAAFELDPQLKEAGHLSQLSQLEPRYQQGVRAAELGLWREAYRSFRWVADRDIGYKDAWQRMEGSMAKASYTLAYVPLFNELLYTAQLNGGAGQLEYQLSANVKQEVMDLKDPLIMLLDRDHTDELLAEQQRSMSGVYDDRYVAEAGKLLGARFVLTGRILRFDDVLSKQIEVQMQVIDAENGRIRLAEVIRVNKQEIARGAPRAQLLERAAKRMAQRLADFDPDRS
ncbi:MAG: hypothetical protein KDC00_01410 [Flavobacteriales bacterium]|nr:hypothetical protein [Flavobacteriales bacterium]